jgi:hypothetical protein
MRAVQRLEPRFSEWTNQTRRPRPTVPARRLRLAPRPRSRAGESGKRRPHCRRMNRSKKFCPTLRVRRGIWRSGLRRHQPYKPWSDRGSFPPACARGCKRAPRPESPLESIAGARRQRQHHTSPGSAGKSMPQIRPRPPETTRTAPRPGRKSPALRRGESRACASPRSTRRFRARRTRPDG